VIRKRFSGLRSLRIVAWTAILIGWMTAAVARVANNAAQAAPTEAPPVKPSVTTTTVLEPIPAMPEQGLVVLRQSDLPPPPEPTVRRVVVRSSGSAPAGPVQSSGS
jgi:hypothetical protein